MRHCYTGTAGLPSLSPPDARGSLTRSAGQYAHVVGVDEVRRGPAVEVVFGHAGIGKGLPAFGLARVDRAEEGEAADLLVAAGIVDLVEFVARAELGADRIPQELHQLDPLDRSDAAGAAHIKVEVFAQFRNAEVAGMRIEVNEAAGDGLLDLVLDLDIGVR